MRLSRTAIVISVLAGTALALPALAVQDTPAEIDGVDTVCTGVGSGKDDPRWGDYPIPLVLASPGGADMTGAHVILAQDGKTLVETDCDAPWVLFAPEPGEYTVTATLAGEGANGGSRGETRSAKVAVSGKGPQKTLTLTFARQTAAQ